MPKCFKEAFQSNKTIIIDCFEIFTEKTLNLQTSAQCWSNYNHHTIKFLIGITPQGTIPYISEAWDGRASNKFITVHSSYSGRALKSKHATTN